MDMSTRAEGLDIDNAEIMMQLPQNVAGKESSCSLSTKQAVIESAAVNSTVETATNKTSVNVNTVFVKVRLSKTARDWQTIRTVNVPLSENVDLSLSKVRECLGLDGDCRIIDPNKRYPAFLNCSDTIDSRELSYFKKYGFFRVIDAEIAFKRRVRDLE